MTSSAWPNPYRVALVSFVLADEPPDTIRGKLDQRRSLIADVASRLGWDTSAPFKLLAVNVPRLYRQALLRANGVSWAGDGWPWQLSNIQVARASASPADLLAAAFVTAVSYCGEIENRCGVSSPFRTAHLPGFHDQMPRHLQGRLVERGVSFGDDAGRERSFLAQLRGELHRVDWGAVG